jgi:hypothetical protein
MVVRRLPGPAEELKDMPEATSHAAILIATSYQAMNRAEAEDPLTVRCDCTVTIAFAGFYVEANLNYLIRELGRDADLAKAYGTNAGLKAKLAFFYREYIAAPPSSKDDAYDRLESEFPGITELAGFRNDICHGTMNETLANLSKTRELRQQAKNMVVRLFAAANERAGRNFQRTLVSYLEAAGLQPPPSVPEN